MGRSVREAGWVRGLERLEATLVQKAQALVGGRSTVLIVDDTALVEQGRHSWAPIPP